jgi:hypothetical protein
MELPTELAALIQCVVAGLMWFLFRRMPPPEEAGHSVLASLPSDRDADTPSPRGSLAPGVP